LYHHRVAGGVLDRPAHGGPPHALAQRAKRPRIRAIASSMFTRELNADGIYVVWLGLPIPDGPGFKKSFPVVNAILESVARKRSGFATFVDTWHLLDDFHGRYAAYLRVHGKLTQIRLPDGVHYTQAGGDLIAAQVVEQLRVRYRFGT